MKTVTALILSLLIVGCKRQAETLGSQGKVAAPGPLGNNVEWCQKNLGEPVDREGNGWRQYLVNGITIGVIFDEAGVANSVAYMHDSSLPIPLTETEIQQFLRDNADGKKWTLRDRDEVAKNDAESLAYWTEKRQQAVEDGDSDQVKNADTMIRIQPRKRRREWSRDGASASCEDDRVMLYIRLDPHQKGE